MEVHYNQDYILMKYMYLILKQNHMKNSFQKLVNLQIDAGIPLLLCMMAKVY